MDIWLKDDTGKPNIEVSLYALGFVVASAKLIFSGCTILGLTLSQFGGSEFALVIGALGTVYAARKHSDNMASK